MRLVASALRVFAADVDAHRTGHCRGTSRAACTWTAPSATAGLCMELLPELLDRDAVRACPRRALTTVDLPGYS